MAKNGLNAANYRGWIDETINIDERLNRIFSNFVIGTPAFDLSKKGRGLYDYYEYQEVSDYKILQNDLISGIEFNFHENYEQLKNAIIVDNFFDFKNELPDILKEGILIYSGSNNDSKFYNEYFKDENYSAKGKHKEQILSNSECKKIAVAIDKLFYHIRNGFAHGCYTYKEQNQERFYIIQDENKDKFISARIILKESTFEKWIYYFQKRKELLKKEGVA